MKYDLEVVVPVSSKYPARLDDFKKYGIFNVGESKVLLTLILSGEELGGLEEGWAAGIEARVAKFKERDYVTNVYKHFLDKDPAARWTMRVDDDSCTDASGLLSNLDSFFDSDMDFYLGASLSEMGLCAMLGPESMHKRLYREAFGEIYLKIRHEIECCVLSHSGLKRILKNQKSRSFLEKRCGMEGGAIDVALSAASTIAKLWPVDLPFATHLPEVNRFSAFGGCFNHIHMICRDGEGENFQERCGQVQFAALTRAIGGVKTEKELLIEGRKFIMETEDDMRLYEFRKDRSARIKFDDMNYVWAELDGEICLFDDYENVKKRFSIDEEGNLIDREDEENGILKSVSPDLAKMRVRY